MKAKNYSTGEAAVALKISRQAVLKAIDAKRLRARKNRIGGRVCYVITEKSLLEFKSQRNGVS